MFATTIAVLAQARGPYDHMWGPADGWMMVWMIVLPLVALGVLTAIVWAVSRATRPPHDDPGARARTILDERYARGEISTDEYRERLDNLR